MAVDFYSVGAARRSLGHFASGKLLSAGLGIAYLLTTVRVMVPGDYGRYVAVLAMCEIFYLVTGLGLSTIAQRYIAEYRVRATAEEFNGFLRGALRKRLALSVAFAFAVVLLWQPLMLITGLVLDAPWRGVLAVLLVASAGVSFLEEIMGALLLQGYSQALIVGRNLAKLGLVTGMLLAGSALSLNLVMFVETGIAAASWLAAEWLVRRWAHRAPSSAQSKPGFSAPHLDRVALRFYAVQLVGQVYGPNTVKLLVTRMLGVTQTAALGVAQSVVDMLRNYMPAHLLAAWVRPIMVARYVERRDLGELSLIANLVLKLNLLGLLPAAAIFAVLGDPLMAWVTAGRYTQLGLLLSLLAVVVVLQSAHLLLTMITLTLEQPGVSLRATLSAAATLPLLVLAMLAFGLTGAAWGLIAGELVWVGVAWSLLRRRGYGLTFDAVGAGKLASAAVCAGAAAFLCLNALSASWWVAGLALAIAYVVLLALLRPAGSAEVALVRRLLASRGKPS